MKKKIINLFSLTMCALLATSCGETVVDYGDWESVQKEYLEEINIGTDKEVAEDKLANFTETNPLKIALVTDSGTLDDHSFNESAWKGVNEFAVKNGKGKIDNKIVKTGKIHTMYYQPAEDAYDTNGRFAAMKEAATKFKADVIVLPGYLFQGAIKLAINDHAFDNVHLLALDCVKQDDENTPYEYNERVTSVIYREEQSGFLAGYAAVKEGFKKLGFVGGMAVPAVVRYGSGYVQGAAYAAQELNLSEPVSVQYYYAGKFGPTTEATTFADTWYQNGSADVIFACGGAVYQSVLEASKINGNKKWIGVDVNQYADSSVNGSAVLTSAMKNLQDAVEVLLTTYCENDQKWSTDLAENVVTVGCKSDSCKLPTPEADGEGCWNFSNFTVEEYETFYEKVKNGTVQVNSFSDNETLKENNFGVNPQYCTVNYIG